MNLRAALPLCLTVALACGKEQKPVAPAHEAPLAQLVKIDGTVMLTRPPASAQPATVGPLRAGDTLETGAASSARVRFADGREVELVENARFKLAEEGGEVLLDLSQGAIVSRSGASAGSKLQLTLLTPYGFSRIPAEAEVTMRVEDKGARLEVRTGEITFVGKDGQRTSAGPGDRVEVSLGAIEIVRTPTAKPALQAEAIQVRLKPERGEVLVQPATAKKFGPAPKGSQPIAEGTGYKLGSSGLARLEAEGLRVQLEPGASGQIGPADRQDDERRYRLRLETGRALISLDSGKASVWLSGPGGEVTLASTEESSVATSQGPKGPRVEVLTGRILLQSGGVTKELSAGGVADLGQGGLDTGARAPPPIVLPFDRFSRVHANGLDQIGLGLPEGANGARVEVASDPRFEQVLLAGKLTGDALAVPVPSGGELYWRVAEPQDRAKASGRALFEPDTSRGARDSKHPHSEVADTGQRAVVYFQGALPSLTLTYPAAEGAKRYRVRIYRASDLAIPVVDQTASGIRCEVKAGRLTEGEYLWYSTPLNTAGAEIGGGRMNKLALSYDNAVASLAIDRPRPEEKLAGATVPVRGVAPLGTRLFVNGQPARLDGKGRFELTLPYAELVVFRLVSDNAESYWIRHVQKTR